MQPQGAWKPVTIDPTAFGELLLLPLLPLPLPLLLRILATSFMTYRGNGKTASSNSIRS